jgi:hypothetical protein
VFNFLNKNNNKEFINITYELHINNTLLNHWKSFVLGMLNFTSYNNTINTNLFFTTKISTSFLSVIKRRLDIFLSDKYNLSISAVSDLIAKDKLVYLNNKIINKCHFYL